MTKVELNLAGRTCEFGHADETVADFSVNVGKRFAEYYSACAEHAHAVCANCKEALTNDGYVITPQRYLLCADCDMADRIIGLMD